MEIFVPDRAAWLREEQLLNMLEKAVPADVSSKGIDCREEQLLNMLEKAVPADVSSKGIDCREEQLLNM